MLSSGPEVQARANSEHAAAQTSGRPNIDIRNLRQGYVTESGRVVQALDRVTLTIENGQFICVVGPSGCGKTTLLRVIAGLETGYEGDVVLGDDSTHHADRLPITVVFQQDSTLPWMKVLPNVLIGLSGLKLSRREARDRALAYLNLVGLSDFVNAYPHELSGGMRQRVAIARALAPEPTLLLMDEPLAALDAQTRLIMQSELIEITKRTESTVLYITHDVEEAVTLGDRVCVMTRRPGTLKSDMATPWPAHGGKGAIDILEYRAQPDVTAMVEELSLSVREEVGGTLTKQHDG
jgi:NitT/TauT family transport system ATP-binding protein